MEGDAVVTITREQFVVEARDWLGTPYQHQGRLKGTACDCIGLVIGVSRAVGLDVPDAPDYGRRPDGRLRGTLEAHLSRVPLADAQGGDVLLFAWHATPIHVAILTDPDHFIHAYLPNRCVVESRLDEKTRRNVIAAYCIPGVV